MEVLGNPWRSVESIAPIFEVLGDPEDYSYSNQGSVRSMESGARVSNMRTPRTLSMMITHYRAGVVCSTQAALCSGQLEHYTPSFKPSDEIADPFRLI